MNQQSLNLAEGEHNEAQTLTALSAGLRDAADLEKWPLRLVEITDVFEAVLRRLGRNESARQIAELMVFELARNQGGKPVYLPSGKRIHDVLRARRIFDRVGTSDPRGEKYSVERLAEMEGICLQQAYQDYSMIRALERQRRQPKLV